MHKIDLFDEGENQMIWDNQRQKKIIQHILCDCGVCADLLREMSAH
jgi:hypothetical protein